VKFFSSHGGGYERLPPSGMSHRLVWEKDANLKMEAVGSSETFVSFNHATGRHNFGANALILSLHSKFVGAQNRSAARPGTCVRSVTAQWFPRYQSVLHQSAYCFIFSKRKTSKNKCTENKKGGFSIWHSFSFETFFSPDKYQLALYVCRETHLDRHAKRPFQLSNSKQN
jgi:hypothetical protein